MSRRKPDSRKERTCPQEQPAVRTTIVGGRPPGSGRAVGDIPRGIEVLIKKASVDPEFKALLLDRRAAAAAQIDLVLDASEAMIINGIPAAQLEAIIARTKVDPRKMPAFLGKAAAVMLAALGASTVVPGASEGAPRGERPGPPPTTAPAEAPGVAGILSSPPAAPAATQPTQPASRDQRLVYILRNEKFSDVKKLLERLRAEPNKSIRVVIDSVGDAASEAGVDLFDQLKKAGFDNIKYATDGPSAVDPNPPDEVRSVRGIRVVSLGIQPVAGIPAGDMPPAVPAGVLRVQIRAEEKPGTEGATKPVTSGASTTQATQPSSRPIQPATQATTQPVPPTEVRPTKGVGPDAPPIRVAGIAPDMPGT